VGSISEQQAAVYDAEKFTFLAALIYILITLVSLVLRLFIFISLRLFAEGTQTHEPDQMLRYKISEEFFTQLVGRELSNDILIAKAESITYPQDVPREFSTARRSKSCTRHRKGLKRCFS
jgi:hypothetical protein